MPKPLDEPYLLSFEGVFEGEERRKEKDLEELLNATALACIAATTLYLCFARLRDMERFDELAKKIDDLNERIERNRNLDDYKS